MPAMAGFALLDFVAFAAYLAILYLIVRLSRQDNKNVEDYVSGGRHIPWWAAAMSFMATAISAGTFLGNPDAAFKTNLSFIMGNVSSIIALIVVSVFFVPAFYKFKARTVYDVLDQRFGSAAAVAGSVSFLIGRLLGSGVRLFMASIPLAMILSGNLQGDIVIQSLILFMMVAVALLMIYNGGIRTVIWTDVAQFVILIGTAVVTVLFVWYQLSDQTDWATVSELFATGGPDGSSKFTVIDMSAGADFNVFGTIIGISLLLIGAYGCDQDMTQRLMTCKDTKESRRSIWAIIAMSIPKDIIFAAVGLSLFAYYMTVSVESSSDSVFSGFIFDQMPAGIKGLAVCGLCAAAISGLTSEINAMSSTFTLNCLKVWKPDEEDAYYLRKTKLGIPIWAMLLAVMAICIASAYDQSKHQSLLSYALKPMIYAYSGLVGIFFCALFTKRGNSASAIIALFSGFLSISFMSYHSLASFAVSNADGGISLVRIPFPWQMTIATLIAFAICLCGSPAQTEKNT